MMYLLATMQKKKSKKPPKHVVKVKIRIEVRIQSSKAGDPSNKNMYLGPF